MDTKKKPDRRVMKTKKAIRNALAELLIEQDIENITVKDIADKADINRKTFYNYYVSVFQVVDEIENEISQKFNDTLSDISTNDVLNDPKIVFDRINEIISDDSQFYEYLFRMENNQGLVTRLSDRLIKQTTSSLTEMGIEKTNAIIISDFYITGMIKAYKNWVNSDKAVTLETIADTLSVLIANGTNGFIAKAGNEKEISV